MTIVTTHHVGSADQHLAIFGNHDVDSVEWFSDRTHAIIIGTIGCDNAGFSHAVTLQNVNARTQKRIRKRGRQRGAAGNKVTQAATDAFAPFGEHQPISYRVLQFQPYRYAPSLV